MPMQEIRHTYLHFMLDQLVLKRPAAMKRLAPLLKEVQASPLEESFKTDITLLTTECLIRAIEARMIQGGKAAEPKRQQEVREDMAEGYILTEYFFESLSKFEQEPTSLKDAFGDFLYYMDVGHETKRASEIQYSAKAQKEVVTGKNVRRDPLEVAQQKIADGDLNGAQVLAQEVVAKNSSDAPRACFILGEIATLNKDKDTAIKYFQQALQTGKDPTVIAWSHIYLGRIYDVDQERDLAVKHYQAALRAGDDSPQTKAAAERGLKSAYERRTSPQEDQ
jgi:tetratricopeptide (TPR) repeat protein